MKSPSLLACCCGLLIMSVPSPGKLRRMLPGRGMSHPQKESPVLRRLGMLLGVSSPSLAERGPPCPGGGMRRGGGARLV